MTDSSQPQLPPKPRRRVVLNIVFSILARLQSGVFSYLSTLLLLRALSLEEYGLWSLLFIGTISNIGLVARLGLANAIRRFTPEYFQQSNYRMIARLFRTSNLLQLAAAVLLVLIALVWAEELAIWMKFPQSADLLRVFAVGALVYLLGENVRVLLAGLFMHRTIFTVNTIYSALRLAGIFWATRYPDPFAAVIVAETILYGLMLVFYAIAYHRMIRPRVLADPHPSERPPWKRFGRYTALSYLSELGVMLLNSATDLFLVTGFLGQMAVALYGLANRILILVHNMLPGRFLSEVLTPLFHSEYGRHPQQARFGFNLLVKTSLFMTIPMGGWMALMAHPFIVHFFDARYGEAAAIVVVMGIFLPMETLRYPLGLMLENAERADLILYAKITGVLKILVGIWLVPRGGLTTMVWISMLAIMAQNLLFYFWIITKLKTSLDHAGLARMAVNGLLCAALFFFVRSWFDGVVGVISSVLLFSALWIGLSMVNRAFTAEERDFINSKLPMRMFRF
ncbi:MAG: hypothetical protein PHI18_04965 [bacterium]|nr:hypothetical protein [bacterium]